MAGEIPENLPYCGCNFCTRAHSKWTWFKEEVDDVIPLAIRAVQKGPNVDSKYILPYTAEELWDFQIKDPDVHQLLLWKDAEIEPKDWQSRAVKHFWLNKDLLTIKNGILYYTRKQQDDGPKRSQEGNSPKMSRLCSGWSCGHWQHQRKNQVIYLVWTNIRHQLNSCHSGYPMERIHMDILLPFPKSSCGNQYILMVIDQFTKWVETFPIPNQAADSFCQRILC